MPSHTAPVLPRPSAPASAPSRRRRRGPAVAAALAVLLAAGAAVPALTRRSAPPPRLCAIDAVQARALSGMAAFATWLRDNHAAGFVGEVGWPAGPDARSWAAVAELWYTAADRMRLPVTAWAAANWPAAYPMAVFRATSSSGPLDRAGAQAAVLARHQGPLRGVDAATGSFGTAAPGYDAGHPGVFPHAYGYENEDDYSYLADQGVSLVRLSVSWERLQPVPFHALDATEVQRVRDSVYAAQRHGLLVLLDLHGYGDFAAGGGRGTLRLGSPALPTGALADFWRRAVTALPPVYGYDLLNEPQHLAATGTAGARLWESASRQAADAIRAAHGHGLLVVAGYGDAQPGAWGRLHPAPWISDPLDRVAYDAHAYFDSDGSGRYAASYPRELTLAQQAGGGPTRSCLPLSAFDASDAQDRTQP
ncbi:glycoside hydrolase family 5 protein [Streptacidiphilus monticola]|uniref:Glycoside hydrolase family 5 protein n=1 Tax=Streptacidiphilus monticola TaxID=2161674 RepID=A0ABW1G5D3_9ACTN